MTQLVMRRPQAAGPWPGAEQYRQRPSSPEHQIDVRIAELADAEALARLLATAFPEMQWDAARARGDLFQASDVVATYVADKGGNLLATASARHADARFPGLGYVHWVAVDPASRGAGLFDAVMARVLDQFEADGRPIAVLETDDARLPAISAYLRLGFVPQYTEADHQARWARIFMALAKKRLSKGPSF